MQLCLQQRHEGIMYFFVLFVGTTATLNYGSCFRYYTRGKQMNSMNAISVNTKDTACSARGVK